ncbi:MAG: hypothetical protein QOI03_1552 [Solirubrobacteraceae bacterium]|nr:hypothetical protein [Solirubrobacteraceae bacterium]
MASWSGLGQRGNVSEPAAQEAGGARHTDPTREWRRSCVYLSVIDLRRLDFLPCLGTKVPAAISFTRFACVSSFLP